MKRRIPLTLVVLPLLILATFGAASSNGGNEVYLPHLAGDARSTPSVTPTATATATTQPTPTATMIPQGLVVLENHTAFRDSIDALHIVGEVLNGTQTNMEYVKVTANLFNSSGQIIDTDIGYTRLDVLAPSERGCFHIIFYPGPDDWSSYQFEVDGYAGGDVITGLGVTQHTGGFNILGWYEIVGIIRNDTGLTADYVKSIATLYNTSERVTGCDVAYVSADSLSPGESSSFKHLISGIDEGSFGRYRLQTDGYFE